MYNSKKILASMAERIRLKPYIVITFLMTILHSIAAHCNRFINIKISYGQFRDLVTVWVFKTYGLH